ncbi:hypothetical protein T484DRAFT_1913609, partial [Baffinella frigidus]
MRQKQTANDCPRAVKQEMQPAAKKPQPTDPRIKRDSDAEQGAKAGSSTPRRQPTDPRLAADPYDAAHGAKAGHTTPQTFKQPMLPEPGLGAKDAAQGVKAGDSTPLTVKKTRPYDDANLNDPTWLKKVWGKAKDGERRANERAAEGRSKLAAANEEIQAAGAAAKEQAQVEGQLRKELERVSTLLANSPAKRAALDAAKGEVGATKEETQPVDNLWGKCLEQGAQMDAATQRAAGADTLRSELTTANERVSEERGAHETWRGKLSGFLTEKKEQAQAASTLK